MFKEFVGFLKQHGVISLALAVVIGGKANALVNSLVNDLLMPVVFQPALGAAGVEKIESLQFHGVFYGKVIGALIEFVLVSFVVFVVAKKILRDESLIKK
jgi:large conductance mechanosensitive channel